MDSGSTRPNGAEPRPSRTAAIGLSFVAILAFLSVGPGLSAHLLGPVQDEEKAAKDKNAKKDDGKKAKANAKPAVKQKGARIPVTPPKAMTSRSGPIYDPLLAVVANVPDWPLKLRFRALSQELRSGAVLTYYPSNLGVKSGVVLLIHEKRESPLDFEQPIKELGDRGFAESLLKAGYAVVTVDLRAEGNPRAVGRPERSGSTIELQVAYLFLLDRHNRGELNLSNFGILGVGEGANLAAAWASARGAAVSGQDRGSDIAAIALVSPMAEVLGARIQPALAALAPRAPMLLIAGEKDNASAQVVKDARVMIARVNESKAELYPTSLHGFKLLRLWPKPAAAAIKFFDQTAKYKSGEWEPRYNLAPLDFSQVEATQLKFVKDEAKAEENRAR